METEHIVIPQNLGKTIKMNAIDTDKYDVNLGSDFVVNNETGAISLADNAENHLTGGRLKPNTTIVELTMKSGSKFNIDIGDIIPNHVADIFLSNVALNGSNLQLTVANGNGEGQDKVISVDVSDLIPVTTQGSIQGDGTTENPIKIKIKTPILLDTPEGLCIDKSKLVKLVDTTGKVELGYLLPLDSNYCGANTDLPDISAIDPDEEESLPM
ncbi:MAG: hypothetical protein KGV51_01035 [Moraxellaceae bacterium]|nr:hypothetical protein [Moraxellaceae bacterium]